MISRSQEYSNNTQKEIENEKTLRKEVEITSKLIEIGSKLVINSNSSSLKLIKISRSKSPSKGMKRTVPVELTIWAQTHESAHNKWV